MKHIPGGAPTELRAGTRSRSGPTDCIADARLSSMGRCATLIGSSAFMRPDNSRETRMSISTILLIVLVLLLVGALPTWPYSGGWGYYPSGGLGLVLIILLVLVVAGRI